ncbi:hypothetical protein [Streptomyces sp. CdTB01]|uniref:hypothetical protein n=1 Tax=Streptomyces sp. CdTB01 TaxID=1725411 RepID=UPI00073A83C9|nr:hypothetical protein [Streptomyces sp. CdTB01]ALV31021.1 hypothetical protein AS200_02200 [Streptomyces sp. CdTB01]
MDYGGVLPDGRRTGVSAIVTPADIGKGIKAGRRIIPPGFVKNSTGLTRGHLLPQVLSGDGKVSANIVATKSKVDNGPLSTFGDSIAAHEQATQNEVFFQAVPRYLPGSNAPFRLDISAFDEHGWSTAAQFLVG